MATAHRPDEFFDFRLRPYYRNLGMGGSLGFVAWGVLAVFVAMTDPQVKYRYSAAAWMGGVPLLMAGLSLWLLAAYWRVQLKIRGARMTLHGIIRQRAVDLRDVTEARWRVWPRGGSVVLRTERERLAIDFANYEDEQSDRIVQHLRSLLAPEVQSGWNLFAYKVSFNESPSTGIKPGPDEILMRRNHWNRYLVLSLVLTSLAAIAAWITTGKARVFIVPLGTFAGWCWLRATTPVQGIVAQKLSVPANPDQIRFVGFLLLWGLVAGAGIMAHGVFLPRLAHPDAVLTAGIVLWVAVFLIEAGLHDRRKSRRDQEAADLAAKARGEARADPWQIE